MLFVRFTMAALATWRLSFLVAREDGPGDVFAKLRRQFRDSLLGRLLRCVKCVSLWIAMPFAFYVGNLWIDRTVAWLALSGFASIVDELTRPPFQLEETADELLRVGDDSHPT